MTLDALNAMSVTAFVEALGGIFEHSPWVAQAVADARPFKDLDALHAAMAAAVEAAPREARLALLRAHPDLAGRAARAGRLTRNSTREQAGAGLDRLSEDDYVRFHALNDAYRAKFGFPFILAVKGHTATSILAAYAARIDNSVAVECATALAEVARIARFRLEALVTA